MTLWYFRGTEINVIFRGYQYLTVDFIDLFFDGEKGKFI